MSNRPWMPLYVGDYRADTTHLNAAQHGAYLLLIMHYWQQGGLPDDDSQLARIACMTRSEWQRHRSVIREFFSDGWRHDRIDAEIATASEKYERRSRAGKKGNKRRWGDRNAIALGSQSQSQPHPLRGSLSQGEANLSGKGAGDARRPVLAVVNGGPLDDGEDGL